MESKIEKITPDKATKYLEGNKANRPIRQNHVEFLANEMKLKRWKLNGASIVFNGDNLMDGQHRLWAVVTSGEPIETVVVRGADKQSFPTIDTGKMRSGGDALHIAGETNVNSLASAARVVMSYQRKNFFHRGKISNGEIVEFVKAHPGLHESVVFLQKTKSQRLFSPTIGAALHYLMAKKDRSLADNLFHGIGKGFGRTGDGETFVALREKLITAAAATTTTHPRVLAVYVIKAWNAKRARKHLRIFKFIEGEDIPKIR